MEHALYLINHDGGIIDIEFSNDSGTTWIYKDFGSYGAGKFEPALTPPYRVRARQSALGGNPPLEWGESSECAAGSWYGIARTNEANWKYYLFEMGYGVYKQEMLS